MNYLLVDKIKESRDKDFGTVINFFRKNHGNKLKSNSDLLEQDVKNSVKTFDNFFKEYNENFGI